MLDPFDVYDVLRAIGWAMFYSMIGGILTFSFLFLSQLATVGTLAVMTGWEIYSCPFALAIAHWGAVVGMMGGWIVGWIKGWYQC